MADPGIGTRGGSIDLLTALDLLGKAEARVAELMDTLEIIETSPTVEDANRVARSARSEVLRAVAAVGQEKP
jgi:hypothetical protein